METIITVLVTLFICGIAIAIAQVYKNLQGKIADLERDVHRELTCMCTDSEKEHSTLFREIDILQQKLESNIDSRSDKIINKFSEHVADLYRVLDDKMDKIKK